MYNTGVFFNMNKTNRTCLYFPDKNSNFDETEKIFVANILTCILNCLFSLVTCTGNFLIALAIGKTQDLHRPSFILLGCLATSDLLVGLICQPLFVAEKIAELKESFASFCTLKRLNALSTWTTAGVSFPLLAAVSVDRLLALTLHLRYNTIVTNARVLQTTAAIYAFFITINVIRFWATFTSYFILTIVFCPTFLVITVSTLKIFQIVRRHHRQINDQTVPIRRLQSNTVNVLKYKKSALTVLYIYGIVLVFYLPYVVVQIVDIFFIGSTRTIKIAYDYAATAVFINSFINPLVYCWRIREIKRAVKNILRRERPT